jgi:hypothetical protein
MVQAIPKYTSFNQFIGEYPEDGQYKLINGRVCEMKSPGHRANILNPKLI